MSKKSFNVLYITIPLFIIGMIAIVFFLVFKSKNQIQSIDRNTNFSEFVKIPDYEDLKVKYSEIEMSEGELQDSIAIDLQMNDVTTKKESDIVEINDVIIADITYMDNGKEVEVLKKNEYLVGSYPELSYFDEHLLGKSRNNTLSFECKLGLFSENEEDSEKNVNFTVKIYDIRNDVFEVTEKIAKEYFGMSKQEYLDDLKKRVEDSRKWDIIYQNLLQKSKIDYIPKSEKTFYQNVISVCETQAKESNMSLDEYFQSCYGTDANSIKSDIEMLYKEMIIFFALAQKEGISYSDDEYTKKVEDLISEGKLSDEEIRYGEEYVYYSVVLNDAEKILVEKIETE